MNAGWKFSRSLSEEGQSGGYASEYTFDHDLKDFVRETLQNANDAGQERSGETEVVFRFRELTGDDLEEFLNALQWNSEEATEESLGDHVETVAEEGADVTAKQVYEEVQDDGRLVVATVEDRNTHGLYGAEDGSGPFSALVLDELITEKQGGSGAGGSYGLGKAVLWSWSGFKTVFFSSIPEDTGGNDPPRLIARTQLPSHGADSEQYRYEGRGLFGALRRDGTSTVVGAGDDADVVYKWGDGSGRPYSLWGDEAESLTEALGVARNQDDFGTSISVLGFCEPGGRSQVSPDEIAEEVASEASKWFWPAMLRGDLNVTVETERETIEVDPTTNEDVRPFVDCVRSRNETREVLEDPGNVGLATPDFEIEDEDPSAVDSDEETQTESGPVGVYVRLADPDTDNSMTNKMALIRGAGMVVKYYDRGRIVYGDRTFHGVVLAGTARPWTDDEPTDADEDIDDYLQTAEPPRHNDWEYTKKLKSTYERGARSTVGGLQRTIVTDAIKDLIRETREEGRLVAGRLADRLNLPDGSGNERDRGSGGGGGGGSRVVEGTTEISFSPNEGAWEFSGCVKILRDTEVWETILTLNMLDEERNVVGRLPIESVTVDGATDDVRVDYEDDRAIIRLGPDTETIRFRGQSEESSYRGETRINVDGKAYVSRRPE